MEIGMSVGITGAVGIAAGAWLRQRHRWSRDRHYERLASREAETVRRFPVELSATVAEPSTLAATFDRERVIRTTPFLAPDCLESLRTEALATRSEMEPSFIPLHKQGHTLSYEKVIRLAPRSWSFFRSPQVVEWLQGVTGVPMLPTPIQDQSTLSLLCYQNEGDHIQWHYDHNFYRGRHFTVLLALVNRGDSNGLSRSLFQRQLPDGGIEEFETAENSLVVFEGGKVRHRATPAAAGDLRIVLSMTYCADPRISWVKEVARRFKDTAFYGLRALWD